MVTCGRRWARIAPTVYLVAASVLGLNSAVEGRSGPRAEPVSGLRGDP